MKFYDLADRPVLEEREFVGAVWNRIESSDPWTLQSDDPAEVFSSILAAFANGRELTVLDRFADRAGVRTVKGESSFLSRQSHLPESSGLTLANLREEIDKAGDLGSITLLTSGTTGKPKEVKHRISTLLKGVKTGEDYRGKCWGLAYNPSHIAGIQVFLQAAWNDSDLVQLFGIEPELVVQRIQSRGISHLSATPSYFRLLLPALEAVGSLATVERVTCGGERFDPTLGNRLLDFFPNARINNIYASTEGGTLLVSHSDRFRVPKSLENNFRVENGNLHFRRRHSREGLAEDGWYDTGDQVEVLKEHPLEFRFIGRASDNVSVGGYNVNLSDVEKILLSHPAVAQGRVYARKNSLLGNLLVAEYVPTLVRVEEKEMRAFFAERLEQHEIPRKIDRVERLTLSRSGKMER